MKKESQKRFEYDDHSIVINEDRGTVSISKSRKFLETYRLALDL